MQTHMLSNLPKVTKLVEPGFKQRHGQSMSSGIRLGVRMSTVIMAKVNSENLFPHL